MKLLARLVTVISLALFVCRGSGPLFGSENSPKSNETVLLQLCRDVVGGFSDELRLPDTTTVVVQVGSGEANLFFAPTLLEAFRNRFSAVYTRGEVIGVTVNVAVQEFRVSYGETFSEGIFSAQKTERAITETWRLSVVRNSDGKVLWAGAKDAISMDTVAVNDIRRLERSSAYLAAGIGPQRSVYEKIIEPFIIAVAAGVAVYLFFTIRS